MMNTFQATTTLTPTALGVCVFFSWIDWGNKVGQHRRVLLCVLTMSSSKALLVTWLGEGTCQRKSGPVLDCRSGGCGFESRRPRHPSPFACKGLRAFFVAGQECCKGRVGAAQAVGFAAIGCLRSAGPELNNEPPQQTYEVSCGGTKECTTSPAVPSGDGANGKVAGRIVLWSAEAARETYIAWVAVAGRS